jgi:hypothetical protein
MEQPRLDMDNKARLLALLAAIFAAAAMRLVPHPPNFAPVAAMALFSGAYLPRRGLAFVAPLAALLLSDLLLGFYSGMGFTYAAVALVVVIGFALSSRKSPARIAAAALTASTVFFLVSNFGVWLSSGMYPPTLSGLAACYVAAVPFFPNTIAGDLFFSAVLFGGFTLAERRLLVLRPA